MSKILDLNCQRITTVVLCRKHLVITIALAAADCGGDLGPGFRAPPTLVPE
jgi:hypothetical protein